MKKFFLILTMSVILCCFFVLGISAAATNEFGTPETSSTIDLTGMSTDTKAKVVLYDGTEYHTYPAQYIVTEAGDITFNFEKINAAFEKSYANDSVIRIEIPNTVRVIDSGEFNYGKNNNLKEVYFPSDSQVYKFNWGCFENNSGLEKINIPASLTEYYGTNHFTKCSSLKEVTFDEGYSVSYIPEKFFSDCSSLEKIVFPNCVTEIRGGAFAVCGKLKTIIFGNSLQTMAGAMSDCGSNATWYLPASFYASNVESVPPSNMFHWAGTKTDGDSGNGNNPKNITFVYTGTKAQAEALQARFKAADAATGDNCIGLKRIWDATLCTEAEYEALTGKKIGEGGATGYYIVYGYNLCDAFYGGVHAEGEVLNSCQFGCGRSCGQVEMLENPQHDSELEVTLGENGYFSAISIKEVCSVCSTKTTDLSIDPLFTNKGYSKCIFDETYSVTQGFGINRKALAKYQEYVSDFDFGLFAAVNKTERDVAFKPLTDGSKTVIINFNKDANDYIDIKITGITDADEHFVFCMYATEGGKTYYLDNGTTSESVTGINYNSIQQ